MSKRNKSFSAGIDAIFGVESGLEANKDSKEKKEVVVEESPKKRKLPAQEARTTIVLEKNLMEHAKAIAFWERKKLKDILAESIQLFIESKISEEGDGYLEKALDSFKSCSERS